MIVRVVRVIWKYVQVENNLVVIQAPRNTPTYKRCLSTLAPQNDSNERMQLCLSINGEGQPFEERKYLTKVHHVFGE